MSFLDLLVNFVSNTFIPLKVYRIHESFEMEQVLKGQRVRWLFRPVGKFCV